MAGDATLNIEPTLDVVAEPQGQAAADDAAPQIDEAVRGSETSPRRAIDDAPMRSKITLLVVLAAAGGALVGVIGMSTGRPLWPFVIGFTVLMAALMWLCDWWFWSPIDRLLQQLDSIRLRTAPRAIHNLPTARRDELGRIARTVQQVAVNSIRHEFEAKRVRRTMDDRIETATRTATTHLRKMALRDPLTDLANRRFMEEHFEPLVDAARKAGQNLICVAIDMDNFKKVNDTLGHDAGDELLLFLAGTIRGCVRREDYAIRLGGDEFVLLLPACEIEQAKQVVERIQSLFRSHVRQTMPPGLRADLSLGIASLHREGVTTGQDLLKQADRYLYDAKHAGKGRLAGA
jgi:diguanylate cyclase (GGDEF)-like protein